ncbi:ferric reductase [Meridianimarinicoccus roseus]|uniref:Ferric reductase n=1 Tax=Meridianimarinicoccus roseus TaxID=2072018 RepID=A0A2V2LS61_9RHOB|nr:ferric reductase-like transmembrane domain-containing protein [Meridianimarinicoccus roseus]PWR04283.1 ferric reductase [Meridianimarinicoccus roseus]
MARTRAILIWAMLTAAVGVPLVVAAQSPLLAWRQPVYIAAGLSGVAALALLLVQPLLAGGYLPGLPPRRGRRVHRAVGVLLIGAVALHIAGLWITSPPDMIDAMTFAAPTAFSHLGVIAMWALSTAGLLALLRPRLSARAWRAGHSTAVGIAVGASAGHALLIDGTMGPLSKATLCLLAVAATGRVLIGLRVWRLVQRRTP